MHRTYVPLIPDEPGRTTGLPGFPPTAWPSASGSREERALTIATRLDNFAGPSHSNLGGLAADTGASGDAVARRLIERPRVKSSPHTSGACRSANRGQAAADERLLDGGAELILSARRENRRFPRSLVLPSHDQVAPGS